MFCAVFKCTVNLLSSVNLSDDLELFKIKL